MKKQVRGLSMHSHNPAASIYTLGCRVNQYESDAIAEILQKDGLP